MWNLIDNIDITQPEFEELSSEGEPDKDYDMVLKNKESLVLLIGSCWLRLISTKWYFTNPVLCIERINFKDLGIVTNVLIADANILFSHEGDYAMVTLDNDLRYGHMEECRYTKDHIDNLKCTETD